jgi:putative FmdB family regulatory protein
VPIYDFECGSCGSFSVMRRIADREKPCSCPVCGGESGRVVSAPSLALMGSARRGAHAVNERAAHTPRQSGEGAPLRHRAGCGCCSGSSGRLSGAAPDGIKRPAGRPWMISH